MATMTANVKCGNCKGHHESAADVRDCYTETRGGYLDYREANDAMAAETWAENAWLRAAENAWDPDEDRERMAEVWGPPAF